MKNLCLILALAGCALVASSASIRDLENDDPVKLRWEAYKAKHEKNYTSEEEENFRFELFIERLREVNKHNAESSDYRQEVNHLSDRTPEELKQLNGLKLPADLESIKTKNFGFINRNNDDVPEALNWAEDKRIVGSVKNQGQCGSCWAFATTGLLEGQEHLNSTGGIVELSEQQLVDCDRENDDNGCQGGLMNEALEYIVKSKGLETEQGYPYKSKSGYDHFKCHHDKTKSFVTTRRLTGGKVLDLDSEDDLKEILAKYGPIAVGINAGLISFSQYKGGVYFDKRCNPNDIDHAVLLTGYGTTEDGKDYWIIKNSWSTHWGVDGYVWLARNRDNHCGILTIPTIALGEKD